MPIYDCFLYSGEAELLDIRLNVLDSVVERFVLVEGDRTFTGKPKPLRFEEQQEAFARFLPRITYVRITAPFQSAWENEHHARMRMLDGLKGCRPDDTILVSDLDEVPDPAKVLAYQHEPGIKALQMWDHYYFLNCRSPEPWPAPKMLSYADLLLAGGPALVRVISQGVTFVPEAGHHWSYLMDPARIREKIEAFAHTEFDREEFKAEAHVRAAMEAGRDLFGRNTSFRFVPIDDTYPAYVRDNQARFAHLIRPAGTPVVSAAPAPAAPVGSGNVGYTHHGLYELHGLLGQLGPADFDGLIDLARGMPAGGTYLEVGSLMGLSTCIAGLTLQESNPTARMIAVDLWEDVYLEAHGWRAEPAIGNHHLYDIFRTNLVETGLEGFVEAWRLDSVQAAAGMADGSIDAIFLDGDASEAGCLRDLESWHPKLKARGRLVGRGCLPGSGVERAVMRFTAERGIGYRRVFPGAHGFYEIAGKATP